MPKKSEVVVEVEEESTELAVSPELAQELALAAEEDAALERPSLASISLKSGVMTYLDTPVPENTMDVIVVGFSFERAYYDVDFDSDNPVPPACYALSLHGKDMGPDQDYGQGTDCETCEKNKWKSGRGKGKACGEKRRLLVIPAAAVEHGTLEGTEMAMMKVSVTSVKNWGTYVNKLRSGVGRPSWSVVTTVKLVPDAKTQQKLLFSMQSLIGDPDLIGELRAANKEAELYTMLEFDMDPPEQEPAPESDKF